MASRAKVAYLVTHPIQYQAPMLRYVVGHSSIDLTAFFLSDFSVKEYKDPGFGQSVKWDVPLTEGYKHVFLPHYGPNYPISHLRPFTRGIRKHLKEGGFDALWMHGYIHQANLRAMMAARSLGIKVLVRAESQLGSAFGQGFQRRLRESVIRRLFSKVDGFLSIGTLNTDYYRHYGVPEEKIFAMPYTVDNEFFQKKADEAAAHREEFRSELGLDPGRPVILYASKFQTRKRAADLLEAYAKLSPDGKSEPRPYLLFIGEGEERGNLEARAKSLGWDSVRFLGFRNQTDLPRFFDLCDVFVLVSEREPWGLIVNEVMNAGRPVIVTNEVGSAPDLVRDGVNGYVIDVGDVGALTDRLAQVTSSPEVSARMGQAARARVDQWSFAQNLEGLETALERVVGK